MSMPRREFLSLTTAAMGAYVYLPSAAQAPWPPTRPVRIVVPYPAAGGIDLIARLLLEKVRPRWPQGTVVDNRVGGNSLIGAEYVLSQPKDGTTLLITNGTTFLLPYVMNKPAFQPLRDFTAVTEVIVDQLVVYVRADSKASTVLHLIEEEKRAPGTINFGSYGVGSNPHLLQMEINRQHHVNMVHVPYKGAALLSTAVVGGEVSVGASPYAAVRGLMDSGKIKPIAVFGGSRLPLLPTVPTLAESGVANFEFTQWTGLFASRGTPEAILTRIADDFQSVLGTSETRSLLADRGTTPGRLVGAAFERVVQRDSELLGKMNVAAGIRMD